MTVPFRGFFTNSESPSYDHVSTLSKPGLSCGPLTKEVDGTDNFHGRLRAEVSSSFIISLRSALLNVARVLAEASNPQDVGAFVCQSVIRESRRECTFGTCVARQVD